MPANEPLGLNILIQVGPSTPQSSRVHPKDGGPLRRSKSPAPLVSRCWGSHRHLPSSGVTSSRADSPASISVRARLGISGKGHTTPEKVRRHEPWALSSARSHRKLPSRIRSLACPSQASGAWESAAASWTFSGTTSARAEFQGASVTSLRGWKGYQRTSLSWSRSWKKNSTESGSWGTQFRELNLNLMHMDFSSLFCLFF